MSDQREELYAIQKTAREMEYSSLQDIAFAMLEEWFDGEDGEKIMKKYVHPLFKAACRGSNKGSTR